MKAALAILAVTLLILAALYLTHRSGGSDCGADLFCLMLQDAQP